jgi:hypothetical protein
MTQRQFIMRSEIKPVKAFYLVGIVIILACTWIIFSNIGAGVIGNIGKYHFESSIEDFTNFINEVNSRNEWESCNEYNYNIEESGIEEEFIFLRMRIGKEKYIFMLNVHSSEVSGVECVLLSAARYCSIMNIATKMTILERYRFRTLFEDEFFARCPKSWRTPHR